MPAPAPIAVQAPPTAATLSRSDLDMDFPSVETILAAWAASACSEKAASAEHQACVTPFFGRLCGAYDGSMAERILLVEDEANIASIVRAYLEREGFDVLWVRSGEDALAELPRHLLSLMILDIGLPGMDGFEVCRRAGGRIPIIMLTAREEEADRVAGLESGADDYVAKPFSPRELTARVKAVLRRAKGSATAGETLTLGPVTLSRSGREVQVEGRP